MKKWILITTMTLLFVSGCTSAKEVNDTRHIPIYMEFEQDVVNDQTKDLSFIIKNNTTQECVYGEMFMVEKQVSDQWLELEYKEGMAFIMIGYVLNPSKQDRKSLNLSTYYHKLEPGLYRMSKTVHCDQEFKAVAEFRIVE